MATITYPNGVADFVQVVEETDLTTTATAVGSIGLGSGAPYQQTAATGVVFHFTITANASAGAATIGFQVSNDGTNWYDVDSEAISQGTVADATFRVVVFPFTHGMTQVRVLGSVGTTNSPAATIAATARLIQSYEVVGGV